MQLDKVKRFRSSVVAAVAAAGAILAVANPGVAHADTNPQTCSQVVIRSSANNDLVSAELGYTGSGYEMLRARSTQVGPWEQFTVCLDASGQGTIRSNANGNYVSAGSAVTTPVRTPRCYGRGPLPPDHGSSSSSSRSPMPVPWRSNRWPTASTCPLS